MRRFLLPLFLLLTLCACGQRGNDEIQNPPEVSRETSWDALEWNGHLNLSYAEQFSVDYTADGLARILIYQDIYLLIPEGQTPPEDIPEEVTVLQQPLQNIYLQATAAMDCFRHLDALDAVTLSGTQAEGWYIPEAREAMENGRMVYAGKYSAPDYELIKSKNCCISVVSHS